MAITSPRNALRQSASARRCSTDVTGGSLVMPIFVRSRSGFAGLLRVAALALALPVAATSPVPAGETAGSPGALSSVTVGPWQVIATPDTGSGPHCIARRVLGGSGPDRPHTIEFL